MFKGDMSNGEKGIRQRDSKISNEQMVSYESRIGLIEVIFEHSWRKCEP